MRGLSLVAASGGHSSSRCAGLSLSWPLLLRSTGSRRAGSAIVAHGPSCSAACGILPDQGSNPCPLHWQADSQPLRHQGSLGFLLKSSLISTMDLIRASATSTFFGKMCGMWSLFWEASEKSLGLGMIWRKFSMLLTLEQQRFELHRSTYMWILFNKYVLWYYMVCEQVESENAEPWIQRVICRFSTAWNVGTPNSYIVKGSIVQVK